MSEPYTKTPVDTLIDLYPRVNNASPNNSIPVHPNLAPPSGHIARVVADLTYALTTFASMTMQNNLDWRNESSPNDPDFELKRRVRSKWYYILFFTTQLDKKVDATFGAPGTKSEVELRSIRKNLGNQFGSLGRTCTAEIWQWIQQMTSKGYGQMLE